MNKTGDQSNSSERLDLSPMNGIDMLNILSACISMTIYPLYMMDMFNILSACYINDYLPIMYDGRAQYSRYVLYQ